jgi:hypothetical protein
VCDNCGSNWYWDLRPRDFTMDDLRPTLLKHGIEGQAISAFAFTAFTEYARQMYGTKEEECLEYATKQLQDRSGYGSITAENCAKLYKTGLVVLNELKKKGIKHQPRK